jgi:hypothetical protein
MASMLADTMTSIDRLIQSMETRERFLAAQSDAGRDTVAIQEYQMTNVIAYFNAVRDLDVESAARLIYTINTGTWTAPQQHTMMDAISEAFAACDGTHATTGNRSQQYAKYPENFLTQKDLKDIEDNVGNAAYIIRVVGTRAWLAGITCPSEELVTRLVAICHILGGMTEGDIVASTARAHALDVWHIIKLKDATTTYPFVHMSRMPETPSGLSYDRYQFAGYSASPPAELPDTLTNHIDAFINDCMAKQTAVAEHPRGPITISIDPFSDGETRERERKPMSSKKYRGHGNRPNTMPRFINGPHPAMVPLPRCYQPRGGFATWTLYDDNGEMHYQ